MRQKSDSIVRFANSFNIKSKIVNGNNVEELFKESKELISFIRKKSKPAFIEAVTYRLIGHVGPNVDIDVGVRRSVKEIEMWSKRDPITIIESFFLSKKYFKEIDIIKIKKNLSEKINKTYNSSVRNYIKPPKSFLKKFHREHFNE